MSSRTETLASRVAARFAEQLRALPALPGDVAFEVAAAELRSVCRVLRDDPQFGFEQLIDLSGVDYLDYGRDEWSTLSSTATGFSRGVNRITRDGRRVAAGTLRSDVSAAVGREQLAPAPAQLRQRRRAAGDRFASSTSGRPRTGTSARRSTCTASCSRIIRTCAACSPTTASSVIRSARISR